MRAVAATISQKTMSVKYIYFDNLFAARREHTIYVAYNKEAF